MDDTPMPRGSDPLPDVSPQVLKILRTLEDAGFETWCVGGAIRDALLGLPQRDVDLATAARPADVQRLFRRTIPVGIVHGTVGVLDDQGALHEVTTFRRDVQTDGRHAVVEFGASLVDDLARRDFTINAIAFHPLRGEWVDPFNGRSDLAAGLLRAVGDPATRFREDRLRIVRALRFAARLGFVIDGPTWDAAVDQAPDTGNLSAERVRDEWVKGLDTAREPAEFVRLWRSSGVTDVWMPECTVEAPLPAAAPRDAVLLTAMVVRANAPVWTRLRGSTAEIRRAEAIDRGPAAPDGSAGAEVRRWMHKVGTAAGDLATLATWRTGAAPGWVTEMHGVRTRGEATTREQLAIGGRELLAAGVPAGTAMGAILDRLLQAVLADPACNTPETLLALARAAS